MDRMIYTALNALTNNRDARVVQAQNLANQTVPGYRRDLDNGGPSFLLEMQNGLATRAFQTEGGPARFSSESGNLNRTDAELDVAISGQGYFYMRPENGVPALSRRGDLHHAPDGTLQNGAGDVMLDTGLNPIQLPPFSTIRISDIGEIYIQPIDQPGAPPVLAAVLATLNPSPDVTLTKGLDGNIRPVSGPLPAPDQSAKVLQGTLEGSNVNAIDELVAQMEGQRSFEVGMRMVMAARELDESGTRTMAAPEG